MLILAFSFYSVGTTITGYLSYSRTVESELNKTKGELAAYKSVGEECTRNLWLQEQNLSVCESSLGSTSVSLAGCKQKSGMLANQSESLNASLSSCISELEITMGAYGNITFGYRNLVRNSVKEVCCTFSDVQNSIVRNWNITNDQIVCFGSFSLNCSSGEMIF